MKKKYSNSNKNQSKQKKYDMSKNSQSSNNKMTFISFDNPKNKRELDKKSYIDYLRNIYNDDSRSNKNVDINHLENMFTDDINHFALKLVPLIERKVLYLDIYQNADLDYVCKKLNLTKTEVLKYQKLAMEHFKQNKRILSRIYGKGGGFNG